MRFKKMLCGVATVILSVALGCPILAEPAPASNSSYVEAAYSLPQEFHSRIPVSNLFAFTGGKVNYFCEFNQQGEKTNQPSWFQSSDGGNTWQQQDMSWFTAESQKYPRYGIAESFFMKENGTVYWIMSTGMAEKRSDTRVSSFPSFQIFIYENGKVRTFPNVKLENPDYFQYRIAGVEDNGDIVIMEQSDNIEAEFQTFRFLTYAGDTGTLKKAVKASNPKFIYKCYANHTAYGMDYLSDPSDFKLIGYDVQTGQQTLSVSLPSPKSKNATQAFAGRDDGTLFVACLSGIYRLEPGKTSFVKLLDGSQCRFGQDDTLCGQAACTADGRVYIPVRFINHKSAGSDPANRTGGKLYCYSPK